MFQTLNIFWLWNKEGWIYLSWCVIIKHIYIKVNLRKTKTEFKLSENTASHPDYGKQLHLKLYALR